MTFDVYPIYNSQCPSRFSVRVRRYFDGENLELSSDGGNSGNKKCQRRHSGGLSESEFVRNLKSDDRFCFGAFGFDRHEDDFTFNLFYRDIL